ncbi:MAG: hypothetical protein H6627_03575 [Calditrichae bacterium]|nr:hypothetical protein [Calditrichota bacterium]MCB9057619.1 hypothetical protein [Calditrichia bacterium]
MKYSKIAFTLSLFTLLAFSCSDIPNNDVYPAAFGEGATPVITALNPADSTLAGVGNIEIVGKNFSPVLSENFVYFGKDFRANLLEASENRLLVASPNLAGSMQIKVSTLNADLFSPPFPKNDTVLVAGEIDTIIVNNYKLKPAVASIGNILAGASADEIYGLAVDADENVFIYIGRLGASKAKLKKITPAGETITLSEELQFDRPNAMRMGPGGDMYIAVFAGRVKGIFKLDQAGISTSFATTTTKPQDIDIDQNGNLWVAAEQNIIRISSDAAKNDVVESVEVNNLTAVRVYNGFLYYAGNDLTSGVQKIWKSEIQGDILAARDTVLNIANTSFPQNTTISALTFSEDGKMYVSFSNAERNIVNAIRTYDETAGEGVLYDGLVNSDVEAMAWGNATNIYAIRQYYVSVEGVAKIHSQLFRIDVGESGAPYFGRQ